MTFIVSTTIRNNQTVKLAENKICRRNFYSQMIKLETSNTDKLKTVSFFDMPVLKLIFILVLIKPAAININEIGHAIAARST